MIGATNMNPQLGFKGLPQYLRRATLDSINAKGLTDIIKDAGLKSGNIIKTSPIKVLKNNEKIFNMRGQITEQGAKLLQKEYGAKTCVELRDALAKTYKDYKGDGILDMII